MEFKLRDYQQDAVDAAVASLRAGHNPVIQLITGGGKTPIICDLVDRYKDKHQILILTHVSELVQQIDESLQKFINYKASVYSAGLNRRETDGNVVVGSVQSVVNCEDLNRFTLIIVDECQQVFDSETSRFAKIFKRNKKARRLGLSSTPYRTTSGVVYGQGPEYYFDHLCYESDYLALVEAGWLKPLEYQIGFAPDRSKFKIKNGSFDEASVKEQIIETDVFVRDFYEKTCNDYGGSLVFALNISHCYEIEKAFHDLGVESVAIITSETKRDDRIAIVAAFKAGTINYLINCETLCVGFDASHISNIGMLRATLSPGLWQQILGRGVRIDETATVCTVHDYVGNTLQLGRMEDIKAPQEGEEPKTAAERKKQYKYKQCPKCDEMNSPHNPRCSSSVCDHIFNVVPVVDAPTEFEVKLVRYMPHKSKTGNWSIKIMYLTNSNINKWITIFVNPLKHPQYCRHIWDNRKMRMPSKEMSIQEAASTLQERSRQPDRIEASKDNAGYWRVKEQFDWDWHSVVDYDWEITHEKLILKYTLPKGKKVSREIMLDQEFTIQGWAGNRGVTTKVGGLNGIDFVLRNTDPPDEVKISRKTGFVYETYLNNDKEKNFMTDMDFNAENLYDANKLMRG